MRPSFVSRQVLTVRHDVISASRAESMLSNYWAGFLHEAIGTLNLSLGNEAPVLSAVLPYTIIDIFGGVVLQCARSVLEPGGATCGWRS